MIRNEFLVLVTTLNSVKIPSKCITNLISNTKELVVISTFLIIFINLISLFRKTRKNEMVN